MKTQTSYVRWTAWLLLALLVVRVVGNLANPLGLHGDEAQYWAWSRDPDFGYFSKPPMIAWVIAVTTSIFGNAEWAVRLASPFLHTATATLIFLTGRKLFDGRVGFWAAATYAVMPAVWLSSFLISTDAVLLFFWALALHGWACVRERPNWPSALQLGLAIGLGLLSKYAMAFFVPVLIVATVLDPKTRRSLLGLKGLAVAALALACLTPNLMWNAAHDFATLSHTAENANLQKDLFNPGEVLQFLGDQFGVFGPVSFVVLFVSCVAVFRRQLESPALWLAAFVALPLGVIIIQALLSRANANWAVTAYGAAPVLVAVWAVQSQRRVSWLKWGLIGQSVVVLVVGVLVLVPAWLDAAGMANAVKRLRGWPETVVAVEARLAQGNYRAVTTDNRLIFYDLTYYDMDAAPLRMWRLNTGPAHHADMTAPLEAGETPVLILSQYENYRAFFKADFDRLVPLDPIEIDLGGGKVRRLFVYAGYGYTPTIETGRRGD